MAGELSRRRHRVGVKTFFFFKIFFSIFSSTSSPLHVSGLKISKLFIKMPRSKKERTEIYTFVFLFVFRFCSASVLMGL